MIDSLLTRSAPVLLALLAIGQISGCNESPELVLRPPEATIVAETSKDSQQSPQILPDGEKAQQTSAQNSEKALREFEISVTGLGIYFEPSSNGIRVTYVAPESSAADEGIEVNDIVVEIDGNLLKGLDTQAISTMLNGEAEQTKTLTLANGRNLSLSIGDFTLRNLGAVRAYRHESFAQPDLAGLDQKLLPVAQLIINGKYRAAEQVLKTLANSESTNGSYYLVRAVLTAAAHGMLTADSRNIQQETETSLTDSILEDVDLAVELDQDLQDTAAEMLCWLSTHVVIDAAEHQKTLTSVEANDYYRWRSEPPLWYRALGDWIFLLRKGQELSNDKAKRYLAGLIFASENYRTSGDLASACFLRDVVAYRFSNADPSNQQMQMELNRCISRLAIRFLMDVIKQDPDQALYAAAVFNARCSDHGNTMLEHDLSELATFLERLHAADPRAESFAMRYFTRHDPPLFDRLKSPMGAYLYHIEAFFQDDYEGFEASSDESALEGLPDVEAWAEQLEKNPFMQELLSMQLVTCGLLPQFSEEASSREPIVMHNQHDVEFHLITMKLDEARAFFDQEVKMIVPMSAQSQFQTVVQIMESAGHQQGTSEELKAALQAGRGNDLVIGVVRRTDKEKYQVLTSAALKFLQQMGELGQE